MIRIRRYFGDALISIAALAVLLTILASMNDRVRQEVTIRMNAAQAQSDLNAIAADAHAVGAIVLDAARSQTIEHAPLVIFVIAAFVLVAFMLRL
jgi:hypothetical protein